MRPLLTLLLAAGPAWPKLQIFISQVLGALKAPDISAMAPGACIQLSLNVHKPHSATNYGKCIDGGHRPVSKILSHFCGRTLVNIYTKANDKQAFCIKYSPNTNY